MNGHEHSELGLFCSINVKNSITVLLAKFK